MQIYYKEFDDLTALNEHITEFVYANNIISLTFENAKHCLYYWA